jgi:hypothetical protein
MTVPVQEGNEGRIDIYGTADISCRERVYQVRRGLYVTWWRSTRVQFYSEYQYYDPRADVMTPQCCYT